MLLLCYCYVIMMTLLLLFYYVMSCYYYYYYIQCHSDAYCLDISNAVILTMSVIPNDTVTPKDSQ